MKAMRPAKWRQARTAEQVWVLKGYGLRLAVERGHLVIEDGIADRRRVRRLSRIDRDVKRIAIIGHAGTISLDAIRWLHDVKIPLVHLDTDGRVLALIAPDSPDHPTLRRAQARAVDSEVGLVIMRELLRQKLDGQERVLRTFTGGQLALPYMELGRRGLALATDFNGLRAAEAQSAAAYWAAWRGVPVEFRESERDRIPKHWLTFGQRASALSSSPRLAVNPANALLNYLYAILETEARLALLAVGCDPGVGIQHADQRSRDSMACDVMEAIRPEVDAWLLHFLEIRKLCRQSFVELSDGRCRLTPDLAKQLAGTAASWAQKLGPVVEHVAQALYHHATAPERSRPWAQSRDRSGRAPAKPLPTPLTESRRRRGRPAGGGKGEAKLGGTGDSVQRRTSSIFHGGIGSSTVTPLIFSSEMQATKEQFLDQVISALRGISPAQIAGAIGLSEVYCAKIRAGRALPHRRHWAAFAQLVKQRS